MERLGDLEFGDEIQVETGYTNWNRADNEFYCIVAGCDEEGRVILDARNQVCFDGRNRIQAYFVVDSNAAVLSYGLYKKIPRLLCSLEHHRHGQRREIRFEATVFHKTRKS